jgi:hypothetical protein|nr:MAG TPA: hypothetical protein [Crassvirales sp.]
MILIEVLNINLKIKYNMKKELTLKHKLICGMSMKLLMFLIKYKALDIFVDNIIKYSNLDKNFILRNVDLINIANAFIWELDRRTYIVDGEEVNAIKYWDYINEKYRKRVL